MKHWIQMCCYAFTVFLCFRSVPFLRGSSLLFLGCCDTLSLRRVSSTNNALAWLYIPRVCLNLQKRSAQQIMDQIVVCSHGNTTYIHVFRLTAHVQLSVRSLVYNFFLNLTLVYNCQPWFCSMWCSRGVAVLHWHMFGHLWHLLSNVTQCTLR